MELLCPSKSVSRVLSCPLVHLALDQFTVKQLSPCCNVHVCLGRLAGLSAGLINPNQARSQRDAGVLSVTLDCRLVPPRPCRTCSQRAGMVAVLIPRSAENVPVKRRRPKPQIPDQGKNAVRKAARSSSLDLELEATEGFLARSSLTVRLHNFDRGRIIYKNIPEVDILGTEQRKNVFPSLD